MDKIEIEQFRKRLVDLKSDLLRQEEEFKEDGRPVELDQTKVGRLSRMDAIQAQQMALETSRRRQQQLVKIDSALGRIDSDEYGYCLRCDEEIDVRRLQVDPANTLCIKCADR